MVSNDTFVISWWSVFGGANRSTRRKPPTCTEKTYDYKVVLLKLSWPICLISRYIIYIEFVLVVNSMLLAHNIILICHLPIGMTAYLSWRRIFRSLATWPLKIHLALVFSYQCNFISGSIHLIDNIAFTHWHLKERFLGEL